MKLIPQTLGPLGSGLIRTCILLGDVFKWCHTLWSYFGPYFLIVPIFLILLTLFLTSTGLLPLMSIRAPFRYIVFIVIKNNQLFLWNFLYLNWRYDTLRASFYWIGERDWTACHLWVYTLYNCLMFKCPTIKQKTAQVWH